MNANDIAGHIISTEDATRSEDHYGNQVVDFADGRRVVITDETEDGQFIGLTWSWYLVGGELDYIDGVAAEDIPASETQMTDKVMAR